MTPIALAIHGAAGRMGRRLIALAAEAPDGSPRFTVVAAIDRPQAPHVGHDAGALAGVADLKIPLTTSLGGAKPDVVIDFSAPAATRAILAECVTQKIPILIGTTGITA